MALSLVESVEDCGPHLFQLSFINEQVVFQSATVPTERTGLQTFVFTEARFYFAAGGSQTLASPLRTFAREQNQYA